MTIEHAYLIKGYALGQNAPQTVLDSVEQIVEHFKASSTTQAGDAIVLPVHQRQPEWTPPGPDPADITTDAQATPELVAATEPPAPKKARAPWSEERKAKQAEVMRATQARLKQAKAGTSEPAAPAKPFTPVPHEKLVRDHSDYAGRRDPNQQLLDSDWPDIKNMLNVKRLSLSRIASDYDVSFEDLRAFIDANQTRENQSPGEDPARPQSRA